MFMGIGETDGTSVAKNQRSLGPLWAGRIGRDEIIFAIAALGLMAMTYGAVMLERQADATLVAAFVGLLGLPVFLASGKDDRDR